jgi:selenocysteine lyase/cysteine desulfurase
MPQLDTDFVRAQFPAFAEAELQGQFFFENAGGSYTCQPVIDRLTRFYHSRKVQPYGAYRASELAGAEMDEARTRLAALMGVAPAQLSFGPSTTANTYVLAQAFGEKLGQGDAIIVTNQDHEANTGPWRRLAARGVEIREWQIDRDTGHLDFGALWALVDERVKLVAFPHCSNVVGEVNPVAEICAELRANGIWSAVDGVSYAPHGFPDLGALGADIYLFSAYKTYGPHQGLMVLSPEICDWLPNQAHYFNADVPYKRFTPAGPDHAQVAACAGMADYIDALYAHHFPDIPAAPAARMAAVHDLMRAQETVLLQPLLDYLRARNDVRLLGPSIAADRAPTVAITHERPGSELAKTLAGAGIMAGGGSFYANRALQGQGVDPNHGVLRLSFVHYTSQADLDRLLSALDEHL